MVDMLNAARRAVTRLQDASQTDFLSDSDLQWIMFSQLILIGEAANRAPEELRLAWPDVPWRAAVSMRNRIVHGYDSIDWQIVYETLRTELPRLIDALQQALEGIE